VSFLTAVHTFGAWAEKELEKLEGAAPTIEKVAGTVLTYAGPALQTIVSAEAGAPAGAIVGKVVSQAQSDLTAASGLIQDFGATPSVGSIIGSVQTNLAALLSASQVSNPKSIATVSKVVTELQQLSTAISAPPAAAAA
jgi:anaerobic glycerol-3-phosphate dehydrogenase